MGFRSRNARKEQFLEEALPHADALYRVARYKTGDADKAQDLIQETFKEAWQSFHLYQRGSNCKAWLFRILFRVLSRHYREENKFRVLDLEAVPDRRLSAEPKIVESLEAKAVLDMLETLPEHYRTVMVMADVESLSYNEIAAVLNLPLGTVMSRLNRARSMFREKLSAASDRLAAGR